MGVIAGRLQSDIRNQTSKTVIASLEQATADLDAVSEKLSTRQRVATVTLAKFTRAWAAACSLTHRTLQGDLDLVAADKAGVDETARADPTAALHAALVRLRRTIYPLVFALVDFLPDDDPTVPLYSHSWTPVWT